MPTEAPVRAEDVVPVRGRISWSAVLAGAALALAGYLLLTLLGAAVGLTVHDRVGDRGLAAGAVVWAVVVTAASLFVGGFLASQLTTGENRAEGVVYGLTVWAVTFALLVGLLASGVRAGFTAVVGAATAADATGGTWEEGARRAG